MTRTTLVSVSEIIEIASCIMNMIQLIAVVEKLNSVIENRIISAFSGKGCRCVINVRRCLTCKDALSTGDVRPPMRGRLTRQTASSTDATAAAGGGWGGR